MKQLVNPLTVRPSELREGGKVMVVTVTCHVTRVGDRVVYRLYRCDYPPDTSEGIPQGSRIGGDEEAIVEQLFPVVTWSEIEPDFI